ncbi:unnamed protein product [marine sediment metagenome]|uniref:Uncharacterized protein n=1 Tax=marine sediment metagenome TaxID=412755 RepID=X1N3L5_9ZZZZ
MSKRIFTKVFIGNILAETIAPTAQNALHSWLLQDNIEVIGAQGTIYNTVPSENDGFASAMVELSQVGVHAQDGAILIASATEGWNTAPAGLSGSNGQQAVTFPDGMAVPVREEGYLYINAFTVGKSAGISQFMYEVVVYYIKMAARRN